MSERLDRIEESIADLRKSLLRLSEWQTNDLTSQRMHADGNAGRFAVVAHDLRALCLQMEFGYARQAQGALRALAAAYTIGARAGAVRRDKCAARRSAVKRILGDLDGLMRGEFDPAAADDSEPIESAPEAASGDTAGPLLVRHDPGVARLFVCPTCGGELGAGAVDLHRWAMGWGELCNACEAKIRAEAQTGRVYFAFGSVLTSSLLIPGHVPKPGMPFRLAARHHDAELPMPLAAGWTYYVKHAERDGFTVANSRGGSEISLTTAGSSDGFLITFLQEETPVPTEPPLPHEEPPR